jgi:hypothetical protein
MGICPWEFSLGQDGKFWLLSMKKKTCLKLTKKQLKNKLDNMKKEYTWFMEFKNSTIILGWNEAKQTVDCSKDWWDEHLVVRIISCPFSFIILHSSIWANLVTLFIYF